MSEDLWYETEQTPRFKVIRHFATLKEEGKIHDFHTVFNMDGTVDVYIQPREPVKFIQLDMSKYPNPNATWVEFKKAIEEL